MSISEINQAHLAVVRVLHRSLLWYIVHINERAVRNRCAVSHGFVQVMSFALTLSSVDKVTYADTGVLTENILH